MPENTEYHHGSKSNSATRLLPPDWYATLDPANFTTNLTVQTSDKTHRTAKEIELNFPARIFLSGKLPKNRGILNLPVLVELENGKYIVSEEEFFNHASRDNFNEAVNAFVYNLSDAYDSLLEEEFNLGEHLQEELEYFRKIIINEK